MKLQFNYMSDIIMESAVTNHDFLLRFLPRTLPGQQVLSLEWTINSTTGSNIFCDSLDNTYDLSEDTFGNLIVTGHIADAATRFTFQSKGTVFTDSSIKQTDVPMPILKYQTPLTAAGEKIRFLHKELTAHAPSPESSSAIFDYSVNAMQLINRYMAYAPGSTDISTSAEAAAELGRGVCQDFAHIMLSLLREHKIPCRYAAGLIPGEGVTHAWTEVYDGSVWHGFDPTHNRITDDSYIKISHGPDFNFCTVERGCFSGITAQHQQVTASVYEIW